jgi:hypothetical protein
MIFFQLLPCSEAEEDRRSDNQSAMKVTAPPRKTMIVSKSKKKMYVQEAPQIPVEFN